LREIRRISEGLEHSGELDAIVDIELAVGPVVEDQGEPVAAEGFGFDHVSEHRLLQWSDPPQRLVVLGQAPVLVELLLVRATHSVTRPSARGVIVPEINESVAMSKTVR
jgi:hypothetical protein